MRRWYIVLPGLLLAGLIAAGVWAAVPPEYDRSATQLLVPGETSVPEGGNPYLYLGGLAPAADVLVRAIGSENVLNEVVDEYPGVDVRIVRDTTTAGPIILITVTASTDAAAEDVLTMLVDRTATVLGEFQEVENIPEANRMTVIPVTVDEQSTERSRNRALAATGVGFIVAVLALLVASIVDGSSQRRRERDEASIGQDDSNVVPGSPDPDTTGTDGTETAPPARRKRPRQPTDSSLAEVSEAEESAPATPSPVKV
ncbi:MAG: hypothetical protein ABWY26_07665 [Microbacterium sp.]